MVKWLNLRRTFVHVYALPCKANWQIVFGFARGGVFWVFLHSPTESNSVEKPLLTFVSIKKWFSRASCKKITKLCSPKPKGSNCLLVN